MPFFTEQMKALTDELFTSKCERSGAVTGIKEQSEQALEHARDFLKHVGAEHQAMAQQCRSSLKDHHRRMQEQAKAFRSDFRRSHQQMCDRLRETLRRDRQDRQERLTRFLYECQRTQQELGKDLHEAGHLWRQAGNQPASGEEGPDSSTGTHRAGQRRAKGHGGQGRSKV